LDAVVTSWRRYAWCAGTTAVNAGLIAVLNAVVAGRRRTNRACNNLCNPTSFLYAAIGIKFHTQTSIRRCGNVYCTPWAAGIEAVDIIRATFYSTAITTIAREATAISEALFSTTRVDQRSTGTCSHSVIDAYVIPAWVCG
jgi:hypothetical protein